MTTEDMKAQLIRLEEGQKHSNEILEGVQEKLFGNGQPGIIAVLDGRVSNLEKSYAKWLGGGAVALFVINTIYFVAQLIFK